MTEISITTTQNVQIKFEQAPVGSRILAFIFDNLIKFGYYLLIYSLTNKLDFDDEWVQVAILVLLGLPAVFYSLLFEYFLDGQTPGKKIMKIQVVKIAGYQANFIDLMSRWVMRIIDIYASLGIVGLISMSASRLGQRLGDIVAGTSVISIRPQVRFDQTIWQDLVVGYAPSFPQVIKLNDNDLRIIKNNFDFARDSMNYQVAEKLSSSIKKVLQIESDLPDFTFIDTIIQDYNYYSRLEN